MTGWCCTLDADGSHYACALRDAATDPPAQGFIWCHLDGQVEEERKWLEERSGLSRGVVITLIARETRPRSDLIGAGAIVNLRGLGETPDDDPDGLVSIRLYAEKNRVISLSYRALNALGPVRAKMEAGVIKDPGDLITAIAVEVTHELDPRIADLGDEVDECETTLDPDKAFTMRRVIARVRSEAITYRRFVVPQRQALERLATLEADWLAEDDRMHLREAADRFARMGEELEAIRERSALMHEQLTDLRAEQIETRTLLLAIVALIFLPITFITGLFGMNFDYMPFRHLHGAFMGTVGFCATIALGILLYFERVRWLRR